jgi:dTDP-L-rhamnose 4-epimerase
MKVLVTGGAGFIGSHVVDALAARGDEVLVVDSLDPGVFRRPPPYLRDDVDYSFVDLRQWRPDERFADVEGVVHLAALGGVSRAAKETENVLSANAGGTARLVEVAKGWEHLRRVVVAGSFSVYGSNYRYRCPACGEERDAGRETADLEAGRYEVMCRRCGAEAQVLAVTEDTPPSPLEWYGASKYMQELSFRGFEAAPVTVLRFSSAYGTRLRLDDGEATIIAKLAGWIQSGVSPSLLEDGRQIRDWVYVGDIVDAALALLDGAPAKPIVNVCSGVATTLTEACAYIADAVGTDCRPTVVGGFRPGDMRHCLGDPGPLSALIGRRPVAFRDGAALAFGGVPAGVEG